MPGSQSLTVENRCILECWPRDLWRARIRFLGPTTLVARMLTGKIEKLEGFCQSTITSNSRFRGDNFENKVQLVNELKNIAGQKGCDFAQLALPWIKFHNVRPGMPSIAPIVCARSKLRTKCWTVEFSEVDVEGGQFNHGQFTSLWGQIPNENEQVRGETPTSGALETFTTTPQNSHRAAGRFQFEKI